MADPTGLYEAAGRGFLGTVLLLCLWWGLAKVRGDIERHMEACRLRTAPVVRDWLRRYLENEGRELR